MMRAMRLLAAVAVACGLSGAAGAQVGVGQLPPIYVGQAPAIYAAYPPPAYDFNPQQALSKLIGKTSGTACAIGDSTMTPGPTAGLTMDPNQILWGFLQQKLAADNPQIPFSGWTFSNFAIGATNESHPIQTGTAIGVTLPSWFTTPSNTWLSYVQAANCDVLFWLFGTNAATSGLTAGSTAATFIRQDFEVINGWTKVPNIIIVTNKSGNPATDSGSLDDSNESAHKAQAAFHRTFARTNAAGYTTFSNLSALGFGLLDLGRNFTQRVSGFDPDAQYFQSRPDCLVNGFALGTGAIVGTNATTVCTTTHGDYRLTFVIPAAGGTTIFNYGGGALQISGSEFAANYLRIAIGGAGGLTPRYVLDGSISAAPSQNGTSVPTSAGQDITITVTMSGMRVQVTINGTLALDIVAPRFISGVTGGTPINVNFSSAPSGSPTINVTEFWEGIGAQTTPIMSSAAAYGPGTTTTATTCTSSDAGCQAGNSINHQRTGSAALDREMIFAANFHIPSSATLATMLTKTANYTLLASDAGKRFDNSGAAGEVDFSLPPASAGLNYCFSVNAAQILKVIANGTEKIAIAASNSLAGGNVTASAIFASLCMEAHGTGQWLTTATPDKTQWTVN